MKFCFTTIALTMCFLLASCDQLNLASTNKTNEVQSQLIAAPQAKEKDQWEYLVVSFGKTVFSDIEDSITNGQSKLVAFQEFADLLSGSEAVEAQTKLDLLGRFGWELVSTVGAIGGDQQLVMKRPRIEGRIDAEQKALRSLSEVLKAEKAKREERLAALLAELEQKGSTPPDLESLTEMDAFDLRRRLAKAKNESEANILSVLPKVGDNLKGGTVTLVSVAIRPSASDLKSKISYSGDIRIEVDGTSSLLFEGNKYRKSAADKLAQQAASSIKGRKYLNGKMGYSSYGDFDISATSNITFSGTVHATGKGSATANSREYPGTWANM